MTAPDRICVILNQGSGRHKADEGHAVHDALAVLGGRAVLRHRCPAG